MSLSVTGVAPSHRALSLRRRGRRGSVRPRSRTRAGASPAPATSNTRMHGDPAAHPPMIACLFVPLFPLAARLRSEPELKGEAVAIFEGNGNAARVVAATRKARRAGIEPGMTLPQARAHMPEPRRARTRRRVRARRRRRRCSRSRRSFSPRVEDAGEGVVYVDLEGHPRLRRPLTPTLSPPGGEGGDDGSRARHDPRGGEGGAAGARRESRRRSSPRASPRGFPNRRPSSPKARRRASSRRSRSRSSPPQLEIAATLDRWGLSHDRRAREAARGRSREPARRDRPRPPRVRARPRPAPARALPSRRPPSPRAWTSSGRSPRSSPSSSSRTPRSSACSRRLESQRPRLHAPRGDAEARPRRPRRPRDRAARADPRRRRRF